MAPNKLSKVDDSLIEQLCSIASVSKIVATNLLEACNNNLEMAINMHMEGVVTDTQDSIIGNMMNHDGVRAPIPQRQEVLVEGPDQIAFSFSGRTRKTRSVFDKFRNFEAEAKRQEELLGEGSEGSSSSSTDEKYIKRRRKMQTLEDLYRPPLDLMYRGSFQSARDAGVSTKKWLLVNVQNSTEFACQVLNRDLWSNSAVKIIVQEHFLFWQIYHDSDEGQRYMNFYPVKEWPYIAVIDPRTGECIINWKNMDAVSFCDVITEFLSSHATLEDISNHSSSGLQKKKQKSDMDNIIEADETAQIEAAIKASLERSSSGETSNQNVIERNNCEKDNEEEDSDSLETFDSDSENVDYSIAEKKLPTKVQPNSATATAKEDPKSECSFKSAIRARVNRNSDDDANTNGKIQDKDDEGIFDDSVTETTKESWESYLGKDSDCKSKLILRLPDGRRDIVEMPSTSKLMALVLYVASKGFSNEVYELVTNFPKRQLSYMDFHSSLKSVGLFPQETIFVQKR